MEYFHDNSIDHQSSPGSPSGSVLRFWEQPIMNISTGTPLLAGDSLLTVFDVLEEPINAWEPATTVNSFPSTQTPPPIPQHGLNTKQQQPSEHPCNLHVLGLDANHKNVMGFINHCRISDDVVNHESSELVELPDLHSMSGIESWDDTWPDISCKQFPHPFDEHLLPLELPPESNNHFMSSMEPLTTFPTLDANVPIDDGVRDFNWVDPSQMVNIETVFDQFREEPVTIGERQALAGSSNMHLGTAVEDGGSKLPVPSIHDRMLDIVKNSLYGFKQTIPNVSENELTELYGCANIPPLPQECRDCRVTRRTMHTDIGNQVTRRIEIHGHPGFDFHAVLLVSGGRNQPERGKIKLAKLELTTFQHARTIFIDYLMQQKHSDTNVLVIDSTSELYTSLLQDSPPTPIHFFTAQPLPPLDMNSSNELATLALPTINYATTADPTSQSGHQFKMSQPSLECRFKTPKSPMSMQRERVARMKLENVNNYMHLPLKEAAKRLAVCPTVLKKICRKGDLPRWPHRKIRAIDRKIAKLFQSLDENGNMMRADVMMEVNRLNLQKRTACRPEPPPNNVNLNSSGS